MDITRILSGITGGLGLLSGVKGMFDSARAADAQKQAMADAKALEQGWYKRNYYGNYLENSASRGLLKRVEQMMRKQNEEARAASAVTGNVPEAAIARQTENNRTVENVAAGIAAQSATHKTSVDSQHLQNQMALNQQRMQQLQMDEQEATGFSSSGFGLIGSALQGLEWGREK